MSAEESSPPRAVPAPVEDPDGEEARPSPEFARLLQEFEHQGPPAAPEVAVGAKVRGKLVSIGEEQTLVDFGGRSEGALETRFLRDESGALRHQVDDVIDLFVLRADDEVLLAPSIRPDPAAARHQLRESLAGGIPVTGRVTGRNAGGLEVDLSGVRGFCPASQVESGFCADPSVYVGRVMDFLVTQVREGRAGVVVSRRALLRREEEEKARQLLASLKPGDEREGRVARLEPFGAFVDLGGVDGLVHVSEIRHERTRHPADALAVNDPVRVRVLRIDAGKDGRPRVALSIKAATPDPWTGVGERFVKGSRVHGTVVRLADFGGFVNLAPGIDGLIHVSEASTSPVAQVRDVLAVGQPVDAVVLAVDPAKRRISLSLRAGASETAPAPERGPSVGDVVEGRISGIKPFGLFVDLPDHGRRARGLVPHEETGAPPRADLTKRFAVGDRVEVEVLEVRDQRIRLGLRAARAGAREEPPGHGGSAAAASQEPQEPMTTMAIALRKALARSLAKEQHPS